MAWRFVACVPWLALRGVALRGVVLRGMHFWVGALKCVACWRAFLDVDVPYPWRFVAWHFVGGASWRGASWCGASLHGTSWRGALGCHGSMHAFLDGKLPYRIRGPLMFSDKGLGPGFLFCLTLGVWGWRGGGGSEFAQASENLDFVGSALGAQK